MPKYSTNRQSSPLKIAIAVHGRFHAFDMARELLRQGHEVTLFTNYPKFVAARFGVPPDRAHSLLAHGICSRLVRRMQQRGLAAYPEALLHRWFGRWVAGRVAREDWDVVVCWSGIGEETFQAVKCSKALLICQRSSAHIRAQAVLLAEETERTGKSQEQPGSWMIDREEHEYAGSDLILVPSSFVAETFVAYGVRQDKVIVIPLAVDTQAFRPGREVIEARCQRILGGEPLRVLNVGTFSFRKGMWDMAAVVRQLASDEFSFRFVGPVAAEAAELVSQLRPVADFIQKQPQQQLPAWYAWGDLFVLPTIEDGYPTVLAQAAAAGLPILTTANGAGTDLVHDGQSGWVLPIRSPDSFIAQLRWCNRHRKQLAAVVGSLYRDFQPRDWSDMAADFTSVCHSRLAGQRGKSI